MLVSLLFSTLKSNFLFPFLLFLSLIYQKISLSIKSKTSSKSLRSVKKQLYSPFLKETHLLLSIPQGLPPKRTKMIKKLKVYLQRNDPLLPKSLKIEPNNEKTRKNQENKPFIASDQESQDPSPKNPFIISLPHEYKLKEAIFKAPKGFLPSTGLNLEEFQRLNEAFIASNGSEVLNKEFYKRIIGRKCMDKRCICCKKTGKRGFKPTLLTPIIEDVGYK